jgi:hypothetical protein
MWDPILGGPPSRSVRADIAEPLQGHIISSPSNVLLGGSRRRTRQSATLASMSFSSQDLELLEGIEEVEIETKAPGETARKTTIWVVVDDGEAFIRTYRGAGSRWFRDVQANPAVTIHAGRRRISATAIAATDPDSIERTSAGFLRKYAKDPSTPAMVAPAVRDTTLRLEPT